MPLVNLIMGRKMMLCTSGGRDSPNLYHLLSSMSASIKSEGVTDCGVEENTRL